MKWVEGITSAGVACGIKPTGDLDLGLLVADESRPWAGTFTKNAAAAASVQWCRSRPGAPVRAVVVNSGNANACTGAHGVEAVQTTAEAAAKALGCSAEEILVASTGPIGVELPVEKIVSALPACADSLEGSSNTFAQAILTTDRVVKRCEVGRDGFTIAGVAKGAAMLQPNMATMLAFLTTDADLPADLLQESLNVAVARSFDRISVDACESTNDSVFLMATGRSETPSRASFEEALTTVCRDLAEQMVKDAEGGTRLVRLRIEGASDEAAAVAMGRAIAASALWRAAAHGADANWGRVIAALGAADRSLDLSELQLDVGGETLFRDGEPVGSQAAASLAMQADQFTVRCVVGPSQTSVEVLTVDLSPDYVLLNAGGTT
jgi:glutamate N-acetyltransferase/amino-acid N-acetyltransferase